MAPMFMQKIATMTVQYSLHFTINVIHYERNSLESLHTSAKLPVAFYKISVLKNFAKFTGKRLRQNLVSNKVSWSQVCNLLKRRLWHCLPVIFAKFLRILF